MVKLQFDLKQLVAVLGRGTAWERLKAMWALRDARAAHFGPEVDKELDEVVLPALVQALGKGVRAKNWNLVHGCIMTLGLLYEDKTGEMAEAAAIHLTKVIRAGGFADADTEAPLSCRQAALWLLRKYEGDLNSGSPERAAAADAVTDVLLTDPSPELKFMAAELLNWMMESKRLADLADRVPPDVRRFAVVFSVG